MLLSLRDRGTSLPGACFLLSPWLDLARTGPLMETHAALDPLITRSELKRASAWYLGNRDPHDPLASPLYGLFYGLPPLLVHAGSDELLLSDATRFAERARAEQVDVTLEVWDDMWHVWHAFAATVPEAQQAIDRIESFVQHHVVLSATADRRSI